MTGSGDQNSPDTILVGLWVEEGVGVPRVYVCTTRVDGDVVLVVVVVVEVVVMNSCASNCASDLIFCPDLGLIWAGLTDWSSYKGPN
jgi:hypothetical protein